MRPTSAARNNPSTRTRKSGKVEELSGNRPFSASDNAEPARPEPSWWTYENWPTVRVVLQASVEPGSVIFTDDHFAYRYIELLPYLHESVNHSVKEFVRSHVHTNGIKSVWAALERSYKSIDHHWSVKHCRRYIDELALRLNKGSGVVGTLEFLGALCKCAVGKRLTYASLTRG